LLFDFSSTETIENQGIGQASIEAAGQDPTYDNLIIGPLDDANPGNFTVAAFSLDPDNNQTFPTTVQIKITEGSGDMTTQMLTITGGQNVFFGVVAVNGQTINNIQVSGTTELERVRQVDIGFGTAIVIVPEPSAVALAASGALPLLWWARRRFRRTGLGLYPIPPGPSHSQPGRMAKAATSRPGNERLRK
jgi:hypothetical protein